MTPEQEQEVLELCDKGLQIYKGANCNLQKGGGVIGHLVNMSKLFHIIRNIINPAKIIRNRKSRARNRNKLENKEIVIQTPEVQIFIVDGIEKILNPDYDVQQDNRKGEEGEKYYQYFKSKDHNYGEKYIPYIKPKKDGEV